MDLDHFKLAEGGLPHDAMHDVFERGTAFKTIVLPMKSTLHSKNTTTDW